MDLWKVVYASLRHHKNSLLSVSQKDIQLFWQGTCLTCWLHTCAVTLQPFVMDHLILYCVRVYISLFGWKWQIKFNWLCDWLMLHLHMTTFSPVCYDLSNRDDRDRPWKQNGMILIERDGNLVNVINVDNLLNSKKSPTFITFYFWILIELDHLNRP